MNFSLPGTIHKIIHKIRGVPKKGFVMAGYFNSVELAEVFYVCLISILTMLLEVKAIKVGIHKKRV